MATYIVNKVISNDKIEVISVQTRQIEEVRVKNGFEYQKGEQVAIMNGCVVG